LAASPAEPDHMNHHADRKGWPPIADGRMISRQTCYIRPPRNDVTQMA
jgi:hypothetical protein